MTQSTQTPPGAAVGITEEMIRDLVHGFYARVRADGVLGPIFNGAISDWDAHLAKLCDFWSAVTLMTRRFNGVPMRTHALLPGIESAHFVRWLEIFRQAARDICPPAAAALFIERAELIGRSLEAGITMHRENMAALARTRDS